MADPGYPCNGQFVRVMGGESIGIPVGPETGYLPTAAQLATRVG